jgi:hypothetical protein
MLGSNATAEIQSIAVPERQIEKNQIVWLSIDQRDGLMVAGRRLGNMTLDLHDPLQKLARNSVIFDYEYTPGHHDDSSAAPALDRPCVFNYQ